MSAHAINAAGSRQAKFMMGELFIGMVPHISSVRIIPGNGLTTPETGL